MQYHVPLNDSQLPITQTNKRHQKENTINRETSKLIKRIKYIYIYILNLTLFGNVIYGY